MVAATTPPVSSLASKLDRQNLNDSANDLPSLAGKVSLASLPVEAIEAAPQQAAHSAIKRVNSEYYTVEQPLAQLHTGAQIPCCALGTYKGFESTQHAVEAAIRSGYRHIDCAARYGNEKSIGKGLDNIWKEGIVKREEVFLTSKLWNTNHRPELVRKACLQTLADLRTSYLDLYLIHWPVTDEHAVELDGPTQAETWAAMEKLVDEGLCKAIGVSNFSIKRLEELLPHCRIQPAVCQVEVHPYFRNDALIDFCTKHNIHVSAYCPLGSPNSSAKQVTRFAPSVTQDALVQGLAKKYGKAPQIVIIRWGIQHGTSVLPKSSNPDRIKSNLHSVVDFELSPEDYDAMTNLDFQLRMVDGCQFVNKVGPYRSFSDLWHDDTEAQRLKFIRSLYEEVEVPVTTLNNGRRMPMLGLGTWKAPAGQVGPIIERALRGGYRHIDCDGNEVETGEALKLIFKEGVIERRDVHLTAQLLGTDHGAENVTRAVKTTLKNLQLDFIDMYLLHWPATSFAKEVLKETWAALEKQVKKGKVLSIGVSNFSIEQLELLLTTCHIRPAVNQVQMLDTEKDHQLIGYCQSQDIECVAYSPMIDIPSTSGSDKPRNRPDAFKSPHLQSIARKYGKRPAEVFIRWAIQNGTIVVPKAVEMDVITAHLDALSWELAEEDMKALSYVKQHEPLDGEDSDNDEDESGDSDSE
ncbi:hypothetical protein WJX72_004430 [[Myrmecia] bisecta]|uniref:NADP-dependent oxidoreductase domain-containing protein n=1 Tax=[Myrmecia] bisecta TaxID=41462 RepID=A0AAW1QQ77_9CHLO